MADRLPVVKGTLDLMVLKALQWTPMHGFEITAWLEERSEAGLSVDDSAIYQALYRLVARKLVKAEWGLTDNNRRARYYRPTPSGEAYLRAETSRWIRYTETVTGILTAEPPARARSGA